MPWPPPAAVAERAPLANAAAELAATGTRVPSMSALLVLLPLRVFLAAGWLRAAAEKMISTTWWRGDGVRTFLVDERAMALPFTRPLTNHIIEPGAAAVAFIVMVAEIVCGLGLLTGRWMRTALYAGVAMNVAFVIAGRVNPSAFYLVMEIALLFAIADGVIGSTPTAPSRRTVVGAGVWLAVACAFVPFFRTMEPADVINDPAIMMCFLSVLTAGGLLFRWTSWTSNSPIAAGSLAQRVDRWAHAKPAPAGRRRATDR